LEAFSLVYKPTSLTFFLAPLFHKFTQAVQRVHCGILQFLWAVPYQHDSSDHWINSQKFPLPYTNRNKNVNFGVPEGEIMRGSGL